MRNSAIVLWGFLVFTASLSGCSTASGSATPNATGDPGRGRVAIRQYGCGSCHTIDGIPGARGLVGPPLTGIGSRLYIAGVLPNVPENLVRWVQHPREVDEKTLMPDLGVTGRAATDIAAYLYSLR